jgi:MinD-like ATPase involved in chromosome partitioning or flagellar assembly
MADEVRGKQVVDISGSINKGIRNIKEELGGARDKETIKLLDHVFCFVGLAGGVGTSTIVANLAYTLRKMQYSVLVIDTNILYPIQHSFFRIQQQVEVKDLVTFLNGECTLGECIKYPKGGDLGIIMANNRSMVDLVDSETRDSAMAMRECIEKVSRLFDFVLIDASNNLQSEIINEVMYRSNRIIAVMDENVECLSNYNRMTAAMGVCGISSNGIKTIMNKRTSLQYGVGVTNQFGIDVMSILPFDLGVISCGLRSEIFVEKGESLNRTAAQYVSGIRDLAEMMEELSGGERKKKKKLGKA